MGSVWVFNTVQTNREKQTLYHRVLHLVTKCETAVVDMQSRSEVGGACSSIKASVNYTVPWGVRAMQHPRAMTMHGGLNSL